MLPTLMRLHLQAFLCPHPIQSTAVSINFSSKRMGGLPVLCIIVLMSSGVR